MAFARKAVGVVSRKLRRGRSGFFHWCPACRELHPIPDQGWRFDGDLDRPTFDPGFRRSIPINRWRGKNLIRTGTHVCHYAIHNGLLHFFKDCTHDFCKRIMAMPDLPLVDLSREHLIDPPPPPVDEQEPL